MKRLMLVAVIAATALPAPLSAATKSYDVVPYRNCIAQTDTAWPNNRVSQYYRNTLDSLTFVWFWVGDTFQSDRFRVEIRDSVTSDLIAQTRNAGSHASQCWSWLPCTLVTTQGRQPVRGRTYKVEVTRPTTGAAISFAYDTTNKYRYGCLSVGGTAHDSWDLALRISGLHDTIDSTYWSVDAFAFPWGEPQWYRDTWAVRAQEANLKAVRPGSTLCGSASAMKCINCAQPSYHQGGKP
jgi:hypothetical protein